MRQLLLTCCTLLYVAFSVEAKHSLNINHPQKQWYGQRQGNISDVVCEVWPEGAYARVELTFTMSAATNYSYLPTDSLESVLEFEMPDGTFFHNSWLWLNPSVVIQAAIIEKGRAVSVYEAIVARRKDPSLLQKISAEQYQLNVYPMTTAYPRKVRLFYSTPFNWTSIAATFALPTGLLSASLVKPDVQLIIHHDSTYLSPALLETSITPYVTSAGPSVLNATLPASLYAAQQSLHMGYSVGLAGGALFTTYPTGTNSGVYQVVVDPTAVGGQHPARHVTFVLDHRAINTASAYNVSAALDHIRSMLLTQLNPTDSFSIFYVHNNAVVRAGGAGWRSADAATVITTLAGFPAAPTADPARLEDLLKAALQATAGKSAVSSVAIVLSNNNSVVQQAAADTIFNRVKAYLGGSFPNRVEVLNAATQTMWSGSASVLAGDLLWSNLAVATGGTRYKYGTTSYGYVNGVYTYTYDLPARNILKNIARSIGYNTALYDVAVPLSNGLSFAWHDINGSGRWSTGAPYAETGHYAGTQIIGGSVVVQYMGPSGLVSDSVPVTVSPAGSPLTKKAWVHHYITRLLSFSNATYTAEIIDSSIRNRVLCPLTAFLALETGDTVGVTNPNNPNPVVTGVGKAIEEPKEATETWISAAPNPFSDAVTLRFHEAPQAVEILDVAGRVIWSTTQGIGKSLRWSGQDAVGRPVPAGLYIVRVLFDGRVVTLKLQKS